MELNGIKNKIRNPFILFTMGNILFSLSTFLLNLLFPIILKKDLFEKTIYLFQMNLFLVSLTGFGLTTGLLSFQNSPKESKRKYYIYTIVFISVLLLLLGLFKNNYVNLIIGLCYLDGYENFLFYLSIILTNFFIFNKTLMNSEHKYKSIFYNSLIVLIYRILGVYVFVKFAEHNLKNSLIFLIIFPFINEFFIFAKYLYSSYKNDFGCEDSGFVNFIFFCFQLYLSSALFTATDRINLLHLKSIDSNYTSTLSFAFGFIGIVGIFNVTFMNFFVGKFQSNQISEMVIFKDKILSKSFHFFIIVAILTILICIGLINFHNQLNSSVIWILLIVIIKTAIVSFFGFITLLTKSLKLQYYDLLINLIRFILVYCVVHFVFDSNFFISLLVSNLIMIFGEIVLFKIVLKKLNSRI